MSWFDTAGIASFAKTALTTAQKTLDKALEEIQDEKGSRKDIQAPLPELDSFFETYGLIDQPSTSHPEAEKAKVPHVQSESSKPEPSQGSFWGDTWGSFFELKGQPPRSQGFDPRKDVSLDSGDSIPSKVEGTVLLQPSRSQSSELKKDVSKDSGESKVSKGEGTVLLQPSRASLFPADTAVSISPGAVKDDLRVQSEQLEEKLEKLSSGYQENLSVQSSQPVVEKLSSGYQENLSVQSSQPVVEKLSSDGKGKLVQLEKIPGDVTVSLDTETMKSSNGEKTSKGDAIESKEIVSNLPTLQYDINDNNLVMAESTKTNCDKSVSLDNSTCIIDDSPEETSKHLVDLSCDDAEPMEDSSYLSVSLADTTPSNVGKTEFRYDVIEMSNSGVSDTVTEFSSDSFSRSASVEVVTSSSQSIPCDNSISVVEIPDLTENVAWDWSAMEHVNSDECKDSLVPEEEGSFEMSSDGSFRTLTARSFPDESTWSECKKPSQYADDFRSSSNSHHTDGSSNSSKDDDDTDTAEVKGYDTKSLSSSGSRATSSSSYVKCSVDDTDNSSHRGASPTSTIASERSDVVKHQSEQNTSGDENETATSSDIEILSPPSGENGDRNSSPLKHIWIARPVRLRRSESPTPDSLMAVNESEEPSAPAENKAHFSENSIYQKMYGDGEIQKILQRQEELQTILEAREKKLLEMSKENLELHENEQRLKNLVQKMREEQANESRDITALTKEFTQRLSQVERQLKETVKDRDSLQTELEKAKEEISKRVCASDIEETIKEKDTQIKELIEEGQKLSKKELVHTTIIKKLRAKEEEMNKTIKSLNEKLDENSKEVDRLRKSIAAKEEQETKHIDAIRQLTNTVKKLEKEVSTLKSNLEDSNEKELSLKISLDSTYKDLTELRTSYALKDSELESLKSGLEVEANENLKQMLEKAQKDASKEKESLLIQIQELRCTLARSEEEANRMEKMYKSDIASLQKRLQEAEERNEDLTKNVSSATRPLVRQIENLQAAYNAQTISWEKIEKNLTDRLNDAQNQLALVSERERSMTEKYMDYQSKVAALESQTSSLRQEKIQLCSEIESLKAKIIMIEESKSRESFTSEKLKENFNLEIQKLKKEKAELEATMTTCLEQLDLEKKRVSKLEDEIKFKDARALMMSTASRSSSPTNSVNSFASSFHNWSQDDVIDHGTSTPINSHRMSVYDSLRLGSGSSILENLQSQLKQREGEIYQLQAEITKLEQVRESMARELVLLTEQNENYEIKLRKLETIEKEYKELDQKYNTLLQMYGEKVEETEELQLDLADVKSMYKAQIEELLRNK